jgi:hypothetical protein
MTMNEITIKSKITYYKNKIKNLKSYKKKVEKDLIQTDLCIKVEEKRLELWLNKQEEKQ